MARSICWLFGLAMLAPSLEAGVVMAMRTTDFLGSTPRIEDTRMAVDSDRLRMDISPANLGDSSSGATEPAHTLLFRGGESAAITVVDHTKKSYLTLDHDSLSSLGEEMRLMMQTAAMRMESLSPEQRIVVQGMLENQLGPTDNRPPKPEGAVIRTSERDTRLGLPCIKYEVFLRGTKQREVWLTPTGEIGDSKPTLAVLRDLADFYGTLVTSFERAAAGFGAGFGLDTHPFEDLQRMEGFPVLTRNFAGGRVVTEVELRSVESVQLDPSEFEPPASYRSADPEMVPEAPR